MKKSYKIDVDCANCAAKMERAVAKIPGVKSVSISFLTQKITVETEGDDLDEIMKEAARACKKVERGCVIYLEK